MPDPLGRADFGRGLSDAACLRRPRAATLPVSVRAIAAQDGIPWVAAASVAILGGIALVSRNPEAKK